MNRLAADARGHVLLLVNPDVFVHPGAIRSLLRHLSSRERAQDRRRSSSRDEWRARADVRSAVPHRSESRALAPDAPALDVAHPNRRARGASRLGRILRDDTRTLARTRRIRRGIPSFGRGSRSLLAGRRHRGKRVVRARRRSDTSERRERSPGSAADRRSPPLGGAAARSETRRSARRRASPRGVAPPLADRSRSRHTPSSPPFRPAAEESVGARDPCPLRGARPATSTARRAGTTCVMEAERSILVLSHLYPSTRHPYLGPLRRATGSGPPGDTRHSRARTDEVAPALDAHLARTSGNCREERWSMARPSTVHVCRTCRSA